MKRIGLLVFGILLITILAACGQTAPPVTPGMAATATPRPPQVKTEVIITPTSPTVDETTSTPEPSPTEPIVSQPTTLSAESAAAATEAPPGEPNATATSAPAATENAQQAPGACEDKAAFYADVTIPDDTSFKQNVEFEKIWQIRNEGTCTWNGYTLVWAGGSAFDAPLSNPIKLTRPGELVEIPVKMHSPNKGGVYTSSWEFQNSAGKRFGVNSGGFDKIWTRISVTWYPEGSTSPGVSTMAVPSGGCNIETNAGYIDQLLGLINDVRQKNGLSALTLDSRLSAAAQGHSEDMACKNYMDHTGSDGSDWAVRVKAAGYTYSYVSENIYAGDPAFGDAQGAFDWWMNSQVHRDNILSKKITQIGIGFAASPNAQFKGRYTLNFAKP